MKKSKFTEEQIVFALKEHQQGTKVEAETGHFASDILPVARAIRLIERHGGQGIKVAERRERPVEALGG